MFQSNTVRIATVMLLLVIGVVLATRPTELPAESVARQLALQSLAPGGIAPGQEGTFDYTTGQQVVYPAVAPSVVNFADVDVTAPNPDSMYEKWLRGEIDVDESESIISRVEMLALQAAAMQAGPTADMQTATSGPGLQAPSPTGVGFASIDYNQGGGSVPPDPELAVGPNHAIAVVNVAVAIYDKTGTALLGPVAAGSLYTNPNCTSGLYDPNVLYDEEENRWIIAFDKGAQSASGGYCLLASQTGDPLGLWNEYFFQLNGGGVWLDYPHAGVGDNFIFMGANMFTIAANGFVEGKIYAFNKANLYSGATVSTIALGLGSGLDTPQPINLHGASTNTWPSWGNTHYFMAEPYDGINYTLLEWDTTALTNLGNIAIGTGIVPVQVVQSGGSNIQANDWRPLDFEYRNGYGWTTMTNGCNPGSGTVNCITWAQIDLNNVTVGPAGSGTYGSNGDHRFFPDLAVNHCNDMAVGYTKSNASIFPSVWVTGREGSDPANQLQAEVEMKAGEIAYQAFDGVPRRWGDYTGMTIDPDGLTFWYLGEYSKITGNANGRWGTYIASFTYPDCTISANYALEVGAAVTAQDADADTSISYTVDITNTGALSDSYNLAAVSSEGWTVDVDQASVTLDVGESTSVEVTVDVPASTAGGTVDTTTFTATSQGNGSVSDSVNLQTTVNDPEIAVTPTELEATVAAEGTADQTLTIWNMGGSNLDWSFFDVLLARSVSEPQSQTSGNTSDQGVDLALSYATTAEDTATFSLHSPEAVLYDQTDNPGTNGFPSQDFEPANDTFDNAGADDFIIPVEDGYWSIESVDLIGTRSNGAAPPIPLVDVTIYANDGGLPGAIVYSAVGLVPNEVSSGDFEITLSTAAILPAGHYWLSVVADADFPTYGQWFWSTRAIQSNQPYAWQNPGGGFATPCTTWGAGASTCGVAGGVEPDALFRINGTVLSGCTALSSMPWLSVSPLNGTTAAGSSTDVTVTYDATGYTAGVYTGTLCINSNDPVSPQLTVPVTMTVSEAGVDVGPDAALSGAPAETVTYSVAITNTGTNTDTFDLSLAGSTWITQLSVTDITLGTGETGSFDVTVEVPAGAWAGDWDAVTVTATSQEDNAISDWAELTTTAEAVHSFDWSADTTGLTGAAGETVTYTISLTNTGNTTDTFSITRAGHSWATTSPTPSSLMLAPDESADFTVSVTIDAEASYPDTDTVTVTATSQGDGSVTDDVALTTSVEAIYSAAWSVDSTTQEGMAGEMMTYTFTLTNTGNITDSYNIALAGAGWTTVSSNNNVMLAPGVSADFTVIVTIDGAAEHPETDTVTVTATSAGDASVELSVDLTTEVIAPSNPVIYLPLIFR